MAKTILITGATGLIGRHLIKELKSRGDEYIALTTNPVSAANKLTDAKHITAYDDIFKLKNYKIDAIINLAGANLGSKRWNDRTKKEFYDSRIDTTNKLVELISQMKQKPEVLVSASGVDYYGDTGEREMFEDAPPSKGYLGMLTNDWEQAALKAEACGIRVVILRTGFVLARDSDAVKKLLLPLKFFAGGPLGSGKQYVSWVHIDDITGMYMFAVDNKKTGGVYNATAPYPVSNSEFIRHAGEILHRPAFFPTPAFVIRAVAGEMSAVVLEGRRAMPERIINAGYAFKYKRDKDAWKEILQ